jgi:hypothetical protein
MTHNLAELLQDETLDRFIIKHLIHQRLKQEFVVSVMESLFSRLQ